MTYKRLIIPYVNLDFMLALQIISKTVLGALYMIPFDRDGCFAEIRFYKEYT